MSTPSHPALLQDKGNSISISGWSIKSTKLPILNSTDSDTYERSLPNSVSSPALIPRTHDLRSATAALNMPLPEICFGKNSLTLENKQTGLMFEWDTMAALGGVEVGKESQVKVAHAKEWARGSVRRQCRSQRIRKIG